MRAQLTSPNHLDRCRALKDLVGDDDGVEAVADLVVAAIADDLPVVAQNAIKVIASVKRPPDGALAAICRVAGTASMGCDIACCGFDAFHEPGLVQAAVEFLAARHRMDESTVERTLTALIAAGELSLSDAERVKDLVKFIN